MGKIMKNGIELSGSSNSAENIKYDETKNVKEAIDETSRKIDEYPNVMCDIIATSLDNISIVTDSACTLNNGTISASYTLRVIARSKNYVRCHFGLSLPLTQECYAPGHTSAGYDIATIDFSNLASYCGVSGVSLAMINSSRIGVIDDWGGIVCIGWFNIVKSSGNMHKIVFIPEGSYIAKQLSTITAHHISICINTDVTFVLTN